MGGFVHLELSTDNVKKAKTFYSKLFGWEMNDVPMPGGEYTMLALQNPGGAMQKKMMAEAPTMWLPYIAVDDVKKTVAAAEKSGGKTMAPYFEVEGMGAGAVLLDPSGAAFGVWQGAPSNGNGAQAASTSKKKTGKKKTAAKKTAPAAKKAAKKKSKKKK